MSSSEIETLRRENSRLRGRLRVLTAVSLDGGNDPAHAPASAVVPEDHLRTLLDAIPEVALIVSREGDFVEANAKFCRALGKDRHEVIGANARAFIDDATLNRYRAWVREVVQTHETHSYLEQCGAHTFECMVHPVLSTNGEVEQLAVFARDRTPSRRAERQLRVLLENVHLVAVILDRDGRVTLANPHLARLTGRVITEIEGLDWFDHFIPEEHREEVRSVFWRTTEKGDFPRHYENEIIGAHGERIMIRWSNSVLHDETGDVTGVASLGEDVTERRREQQALLSSRERLRALSTQISTVEDRERRRFATALHDEISQELVVLRLKLTSLFAGAPPEMRPALKEFQNLLGDCLERTRSLTYDLSPPVLYELGLEPAIESVGERMAHEHGLEFEFAVRGSAEPLVDDIAPVFFRAVRELLMNVIKHAQAKLVRVEIRRDFPFVAIVVEDDGKGFAPDWDRVESNGGGFGLFSIRERMRQLGGTLEIGRSSLGGAVVIVTCPLARGGDGTSAAESEITG